MAQAGASIEETRQWVEDNKLKLAHWFTVDDLMFLFRGGRVTRTSAWAGTMLNIKPVMHVDNDGHLIPLEKVMGRKKSILGMLKHMKKLPTRRSTSKLFSSRTEIVWKTRNSYATRSPRNSV